MSFTPPRQLWGIWNKPVSTPGRWQTVSSSENTLLMAVETEEQANRLAELGRQHPDFKGTLTPYLIGVSPVAPEYQEWLPITTAPRDGTLIMVCWAGSGLPLIISRWLVNAEAWTTPFNKPTNPPTHWRNLPAVPEK